MTQEKKLKWDETNIVIELGNTEELLNKVYHTSLLEKNFRIYKYRKRHYTSESTFVWEEGHRLELFDFDGKSDWTFPEENAVIDLYESVRYQVSNIEGLLEDFLFIN